MKCKRSEGKGGREDKGKGTKRGKGDELGFLVPVVFGFTFLCGTGIELVGVVDYCEVYF